MLVVIGLGNPGSRYAATRHNAGFMAVDLLARRAGADWRAEVETHSQVATAKLGGREGLLVKPQTFMNRSGRSARALVRRLECAPEELLIVYDDFLLDFGRLRLRRGGSDGGHNGLASVIEELETRQVPRLRLGIGPLPPDEDVIDYVLSPFASDQKVEGLIERGAEAIGFYAAEGIEAAMNRFNGC